MQDPLAMQMLEGSFAEGDAIEVDVNGGELSFSKAKAATDAA